MLARAVEQLLHLFGLRRASGLQGQASRAHQDVDETLVVPQEFKGNCKRMHLMSHHDL